MTQTDIPKPTDDPYDLIGDSWPSESESSYHAAKVAADDSSTVASTQSESATDARSKMAGESGQTASAVSDGYGSAATHLSEQSRSLITISAWMTDAAGTVLSAKRQVVALVRSGTSEIKDALTAELQGTPVSPSSNDLITKYRSDISASASTLTADLDAIGHSLAGDPGSSRSPSYTSVSTTPTPEHADPHASMASYTGTPGAPVPEPHQLPPMPRATTTQPAESPNATSTPSAPASSAPHPTLANLIAGGQSTGTSTTGSPHTSSQGSPSPQVHQSTERHQTPKSTDLPRIPSLPLDGLPAAAESVATVVSAAVGHQLPTTPSTITPSTPTVPASTGITPGTSGTPPVTPMAPAPLTPIGGAGLGTQPATPAPQGTPAAPSPASQQTAPPRSPAADLSWIQRTYGLAPGVEVPKPETITLPALFITKLPEPEAHLHRVLAAIRQAFDGAGWAQPLAVATLRKGFESKAVYVTADALSIHTAGILLPHGVTPLDEMPGTPVDSRLEGSLMVTDKLTALIPYGWELESMLSTVPADENSQSAEQYGELVESEELLECKVSRGRSDVTAGEAMSVFARAALGSAGCSDLDVESARLRGSRWVGTQPVGYLDLLNRWYLSDAAESMSLGRWRDAVYSAEKYLSIVDTKKQAA